MVDSSFEDEARPAADEALVVDLDGYEGPLDALLSLARQQKVDLAHISILDLAEQYLAFIENARHLRLEIAADYLVMAAWLAYLKSRLLLPESEGGKEPSGAEMAARLAFQLRRLEAMREAAERLMARDRLGRDVFRRGAPEGIRLIRSSVYEASLFELLRAYADHRRRGEVGRLAIEPLALFTVEDAILRVTRLLGGMPEWKKLERFLPESIVDDHHRRSALASTLAASLELTRSGAVSMRQDAPFGPIHLRAARPGEAEPSKTGDGEGH